MDTNLKLVDNQSPDHNEGAMALDSDMSLDLALDLEDIKYPFDDGYANKPGPSSAGLEEQAYFDDLPVLEKGNGADENVPIPVLPFLLDESHVHSHVREGGWAGWTCVAGSWLVCESGLSDPPFWAWNFAYNSVCYIRLC